MSGIVKAKRISNAEVLRNMIALDEEWQKEHDGEELLSENTRDTIKQVIESGTDDDDINRKFNKLLRPTVLK